ncbi:hypothetical protein MP228_004074 [Amoeboaphelidium protococcarum]|nr:hypothetical protein MP228_004074 [Amoeboaphelidium protococcarum]
MTESNRDIVTSLGCYRGTRTCDKTMICKEDEHSNWSIDEESSTEIQCIKPKTKAGRQGTGNSKLTADVEVDKQAEEEAISADKQSGATRGRSRQGTRLGSSTRPEQFKQTHEGNEGPCQRGLSRSLRIQQQQQSRSEREAYQREDRPADTNNQRMIMLDCIIWQELFEEEEEGGVLWILWSCEISLFTRSRTCETRPRL